MLIRRIAVRCALLAATALVGVVIASTSGSAQASTGDFCHNYPLTPGQTCWGPEVTTALYETEGWDAYDAGVGNCNGIGIGSGNSPSSWGGYACSSDGSGYEAIYCTSACDQVYLLGGTYPFVHNHSSVHTSNFTGWAYESG